MVTVTLRGPDSSFQRQLLYPLTDLLSSCTPAPSPLLFWDSWSYCSFLFNQKPHEAQGRKIPCGWRLRIQLCISPSLPGHGEGRPRAQPSSGCGCGQPSLKDSGQNQRWGPGSSPRIWVDGTSFSISSQGVNHENIFTIAFM